MKKQTKKKINSFSPSKNLEKLNPVVVIGILIIVLIFLIVGFLLLFSDRSYTPRGVQVEQKINGKNIEISNSSHIAEEKLEDVVDDNLEEKDRDKVIIPDGILEGAPESSRFIGRWDPALYTLVEIYADETRVYFLDSDNYYQEVTADKLIQFDVASFEIINNRFLKDKNGIYTGPMKGNEVVGADTETFKQVGDFDKVGYAEDKNYVYECKKRVMPNQAGYELLGDYYGRIGSKIYYKNNILVDVDAYTFENLGGTGFIYCGKNGGYAKDKKSVYYDGKKIDGADSESIEETGRIGYMRDKFALYAFGEKQRNDFVSCSSEPEELPNGFDFWKNKISITMENAKYRNFEFCVLPDNSIIIGYLPEPNSENMGIKNINWFNERYEPIQSLDFNCKGQKLLPRTMEKLEDSVVVLKCEYEDACVSEAYFMLDLHDFKTNPLPELTKVEEYYDCGYRG